MYQNDTIKDFSTFTIAKFLLEDEILHSLSCVLRNTCEVGGIVFVSIGDVMQNPKPIPKHVT